MLPVHKAMKVIKEKQAQNRWIVPRIMVNRLGMNISLWLSAVIFFTGIWMSFGTLYDESISDKEKFSQLQVTIPMVGFVLIPAISIYYSIDSSFYLRKIGIKFHEKPDLEIILPIVFLIFFITLSYVAILCFKII